MINECLKRFTYDVSRNFLFLETGHPYLPRNPSSRLVLTTWYMGALVLVASYVATLVATLTVMKVTVPFDYLYEMAEQEEYKYGLLSNTAWEMRFKVTLLLQL